MEGVGYCAVTEQGVSAGEVIRVTGTTPPEPCWNPGLCLPGEVGGSRGPLGSEKTSPSREPRPRGPSAPLKKPKDEVKPKPKDEQPPKPLRCVWLERRIASGRFLRAHAMWGKLQALGADQAIPTGLKGWMNEIERAQQVAFEWNKLHCGPPLPIIDLPSLSV